MPVKKALITMEYYDADMEQSPEELLDQLQRAYRPADLRRAVFYSKTQAALDKQQHIVDLLDKEKAELQLTYNKAKEASFLRQDAMWLAQFEDLLKCQSTSKAIRDEEVHRIKEIDEKIRQIDKQMHQLRLQLIDVRKNKSPMTSSENNEKLIQILENKLYQQSVAYNIVVYKNYVLREYILHLLILRSRFNLLYKRYNRILGRGKNKINYLCSEAAAAQDQRDEIRNHLASFNKYSALQYNKLMAEVQEMIRLSKLNGQHVPFMLRKEKARAAHPENFGSKQKKVDTKPEEQLKLYQDTFEKIKSATDEDDATEILKRFFQVEESNFKLFNYANELRDESERIQEKINVYQDKLREANVREEREAEKTDAMKEKLEESLKVIKMKRSSLQEQLDFCQTTFNDLMKGISKFYAKSGCSDEHPRKILCGEKGVMKDNILDYLSVLSNWVSDLIAFSDYLTSRAKASDESDKDITKPVATPKYDVRTYSKLSTISGSIAPSIQASVASAEKLFEVEDLKATPFPELDLPELSKETSTAVAEEAKLTKQPYTRSEIKVVATEMLQRATYRDKRSVKQRMH